ncbi:transporter substrate-binding domain-containing protein [Pseudomonas sp. LB3P14]
MLVLLLLSCSVFADSDILQIRARQPLEGLKIQLEAQEQAWLRKKQTLVVGVPDDDYPPYRIITGRNELEGITADYLSALQRELAISLTVRRFASTDAAYQALREGRVDLVDSATEPLAQHYQVRLSPPYAFTELALFAEAGDLRDYDVKATTTRIATADKQLLELYRQAGGQGAITDYPTRVAGMASVLNGQSQAYLGDTFSTRYLSGQLLSNQLVVNQSARLPEIHVGFAFAANDGLLGPILNRALGDLSRCNLVSAMRVWGDTEGCDMSSFRERLSESERAWLEQGGPVQLAVSEDLAPYTFFDNRGRFNGIASELLDIVRRKTGVRFEINRVSSLNDAETLLGQGKADLSILTHVSPSHGAYLFTRPFVTIPYVIVTRRDDNSLTSLSKQTVATLSIAKGHLPPETLTRDYPNLRLIESTTTAEALNRVRDGEADFSLAPANLARYYLSYKYESSLKIGSMLPDNEAQIAFAATPRNPLLISILDKALAEISPWQYMQITGRWRANAATDDKHWEGITATAWRTLGTLCLLLAVAALLIVTQRRRIIRKQLDLHQRQLLLDELQVAKDLAEKASRSKTVFLATMSHEIRTPLNAIIGMLELVLTRKTDAELNTQSVHIAYESAHNLLGLIGDILDIARIESGKLTLRPEISSLKDLIESVAKVFAGLARQKHLSIRLELDETASERVWIDGQKFKQIISNLLSNSIKFTEKGGIVIRCEGDYDGAETVQFRVSVTDTGKGIPHSQIDKVFTPFFELDSAVNNPNAGAGLGLSISQVLSQLMSGNLSVQSEIGVGTSMIFNARFQCVSANSEIEATEQPTQATAIDSPLNILIVEDHLPSQYLLEQQITYLGHHAITANNGLEGLAIWQEQDIDVVLTDCNMPEISGYEMTRSIRSLETSLGVKPCTIIGLTADAQREALEQCLTSGMNEALAKPINLAMLNRLIPTLDSQHKGQSNAHSTIAMEIQHEIAEHVITSNNQELQALEEALRLLDLSALGRIAHKLKGTAYVLNSQSLLQLCVLLEELTASNDETETIRRAVADLILALNEINLSLQPA